MQLPASIRVYESTFSRTPPVVARHERLHGKFATAARLDHYLELLARKPGGLERSLPLAQERQRGSWPECFDELWAALTGRYGASQAAGQMIDVLLLCREHGPARVALAVRGALAVGAIDGRAVAVLARRAEDTAPPAQRLDDLDTRLTAHDRPEPDLAGYDALIGGQR